MSRAAAAALLALCMLIARSSDAVRAADRDPEFWFEDLKTPLELNDGQAEALARFAAEKVMRTRRARSAFPRELEADRAPRIVLLSAGDWQAPAHVAVGVGHGVRQAVEQAVARVLAWKDFQPRYVKLDVAQRATAVAQASLARGLTLERSLYGLAFQRGTRLAFPPEELVAHTLVSSAQEIRMTNIARLLNYDRTRRTGKPPVLGEGDFRMFRFSCESLFCDGETFLRLYRGHRTFDTVARDELLAAARAAGRYLTNITGPDGKFVYIYLPKSNKRPQKYNVLRHAGTAYAMLELQEAAPDDELLAAARRAIGYLLRQIQPTVDGRGDLCVVEGGATKLGGNALAIIALAKYLQLTGDRKSLPVMQKLAGRIVHLQARDGQFLRQKESYPGGEDMRFVSDYYPGEAILALLRAYGADPDDAYLDAAERAARWLILKRDKDLQPEKLLHDHWLLYSLDELYRKRPDKLYLEHAVRIADTIVKAQRRDPRDMDWLGSYYAPPRSTPVATRTEGLLAASRLCRDAQRPDDARRYLEAAAIATRFQLQTQFRVESAMYLKAPRAALGGFHRSLTNFEIRIDYVQHNISALLAMDRALARDPLPAPEKP